VFEVDVIIADGSTVTIREVRSEDYQLLKSFLYSLSASTLAYRFFSAGINKDEVIKHLLEGDGISLIALRQGKVIDHASCHLKDDKKAEMSIVVHDEFQGKGLGTKLLEILTELAHRKGVEVFEAHVLSDTLR